MRTLLACLSFVLLPACGQETDFSARVVGITDGDTLTVLTADREQVRIRLAEIDAPERGQPYGNRARQTLSELVFQETVNIRYVDTDQYGRVVARLYAGDTDVSAEMVRQGAAWAYREYLTDQSLLRIEAEAREARWGLWGLSEATVPPWDWRRGERTAPVAEDPPDPFTCGSKTYCREMTTCEEARFYLDQCGLLRLDGDGDGVPCEAVCR